MIGILLIIAGFAVLYQFQLPELEKVNATHKETLALEQAKKADVDALTQAQQDLSTKERFLAASGVTLQSLSSVIPSTEDVPGLFIQVDALSKNFSSLSNVSYQVAKPVIDDAGMVRVPLSLSATGKYTDLKEFVRTFESNIRPVSFSSVSFTQVSADPAKPEAGGNGQFTLAASGYVRAASISSAYTVTEAGQPAN
jgi:Tfp pilus assembly protein PilO